MKFIEIPFQSELYQQEVRLRHDRLRVPLGLTFSESELQAESDQLHFGLLADDQTLIACAAIIPLSATVAKLRQVVVATEQQGRGWGAMLVVSIEQTLVQRGFQTIELNARDIAVGFYEKQGYIKQGSEFIEVSIPHWKMSKSLRV